MKTKIQIGTIQPSGTPAAFDVATLIKTRLLICANSGGGKSWLLRLIAELLVGTMPVIIFDVEGEFASLREKFDFVLVGPGGETPADCRSAKLVIEKLLELRASAVIDLSELDVRERHRYMRLAAEAAINAPKAFWRPTCFIFDEAHEFCPENGKGESEAKGAVLAFATKGRKRQFLAIFATQRVHKLALDCRAECLNRMIGMTFEPDDLKVAASILGISGKEEMKEFSRVMRTMDEGKFYTFGRAICLVSEMVKVGQVQTRHGIDETYRHKPAPPPEKIKLLLPKLADLPKLAEEQAETVAEMKRQIGALKKEVRDAKAAAPAPKTETKTEKIAILKPEHLKLIRETAANQKKVLEHCAKITARIGDDLSTLDRLSLVLDGAQAAIDTIRNGQPPKIAVPITTKIIPIPDTRPAYRVDPDANLESQSLGYNWIDLPTGEQKVLAAVGQFPEGLKEEQISVLTEYRRTSRYEYLKGLKRKGLVIDERRYHPGDGRRNRGFGYQSQAATDGT